MNRDRLFLERMLELMLELLFLKFLLSSGELLGKIPYVPTQLKHQSSLKACIGLAVAALID